MRQSLLLLLFLTLASVRAQTSSNTMSDSISPDFPFSSHYRTVRGSKIHYLDEGPADAKHTFVLLHGNPTSNYIWRNIVPHLVPNGRVIAPDLIGMGKSDKPAIEYTFQDHIDYIDDFLEGISVDSNIILVIQDWGSGIGFHYAHRFPERVAGIVFFEAIVRTIEWSDANFIERYLFKRMRSEKGEKMIVKNNFFIKRFMPLMTRRSLTKEEKAAYAAPYLNEEDRRAVRVWPTQIAISGEPEASHRTILAYEQWLPTTTMPKLMFHAKPGMIIKPKEAKKIKAKWQNLTAIDLGKGKHYLQETYPHKIGAGIAHWYQLHFSTK